MNQACRYCGCFGRKVPSKPRERRSILWPVFESDTSTTGRLPQHKPDFSKANAIRVCENAPNRPVSVLSTSNTAGINTERYLSCPSAFVWLLFLKYINETLECRIYWRERKLRCDYFTPTRVYGYISYGSLHPFNYGPFSFPIFHLLLWVSINKILNVSHFMQQWRHIRLHVSCWILCGDQNTTC